LSFSLVIRFAPEVLPRADFPRLALNAGVAVWQTIRALAPGVPAGIKWPNDVYLAGRKICGILIESPAANPQFVVIGAGVNVSNSFIGASEELRHSAISLRDVEATTSDACGVLIRILQNIESNLDLQTNNPAAMARQWSEACLLTGKRIAVRQGREVVSGQCLGIDSEGHLQLRTPQGVRAFATGSIETTRDKTA
jgi:BirA family biotin operon repressor/biotin-[acetyl-CoA-carboxylase] ligase